MEKILSMLQKSIPHKTFEEFNIVPYPDRVALLSALSINKLPTVSDMEYYAKRVADMALVYCKENGVRKVLIGGANYLTPFLIDYLMERNLIPVFLYSSRELVGYSENEVGKKHADYKYQYTGIVEPYSPEVVESVYRSYQNA